MNNRYQEALCKTQLARIYNRLSRNEEAVELIKTTIDIFSDLQTKPDMAKSYYYLAQFIDSSDMKEKATHRLNKAEKMFNEMETGH